SSNSTHEHRTLCTLTPGRLESFDPPLRKEQEWGAAALARRDQAVGKSLPQCHFRPCPGPARVPAAPCDPLSESTGGAWSCGDLPRRTAFGQTVQALFCRRLSATISPDLTFFSHRTGPLFCAGPVGRRYNLPATRLGTIPVAGECAAAD